jgi:hypothetical protein
MPQPHLTFACELETEALQEFFADPAVVENLLAMGAGVSLGLIDLSPGRADVVRQLNQAGVPLIAWLLLPKEQGYWFNAANHAQAAARYEAFLAWTREHDLQWKGVGVDIEPDFNEFQYLLTGRAAEVLPRMIGRLFDAGRLRQSREAYTRLLQRMQADGYPVESYHFPFIADERKVGSTFLQRFLGLVEVPADREGFMLYTSFLSSWGPAVLCSYAPEADMIALGSTGGGVETDVELPVLNWDQLARDLRLASQWSDDIFIFSLEGCQQQGFLERLIDFDWARPVPVPRKQVKQVDNLRRAFRGFLWTTTRPWLILAGFAGLVILLFGLRRFFARRI